MKLLVVTNLYPPQELGGYGRCMADFVWGLIQLGHQLQVLCSDASYLGNSDCFGPSNEPVYRWLFLKGSFSSGVSILQDTAKCQSIDEHNLSILDSFKDGEWDGILVGNIDLLGLEVLHYLLSFKIPLVHHIGFVSPPYPFQLFPTADNYLLVPASTSVRNALCSARFPVRSSPVVYPGVRLPLATLQSNFLSPALEFALTSAKSGFELGSPANPLKFGFAGLLMSSKGAHTLVQALIILKSLGLSVQANFAGASFQSGYREAMESDLAFANMSDMVKFVGHLNRRQLLRFWSLHHIGVFPSIHPEAFGISAAEVMAAGLLLLSSGVGGASELFDDQITGVCFSAGNAQSLVDVILPVIRSPERLSAIAYSGKIRVKESFSVSSSALKLQSVFQSVQYFQGSPL